ncbi:MAG TPA: hypothetical protein DDY98_02295 [Ruminococcaceae bacterium]|nr:hypothetical protein [Oscillospiraceae bacterium]
MKKQAYNKKLTVGHFLKKVKKCMASVSQKKIDKKLRLLKSAYTLFESKGVNMTAVDDVVKAAGVAKGTFYLYFKDKHDLIDQMMIAESRTVLHGILGELRENCKKETFSPADRLSFVFNRFLDYFVNHQKMIPLLTKNFSACYRANCESDDEETREDMKQLLMPFLDVGMSEAEANIHLFLLSDMLGGVCCNAISGDFPYDLNAIRPCLDSVIRKSITP